MIESRMTLADAGGSATGDPSSRIACLQVVCVRDDALIKPHARAFAGSGTKG